MNPTKLFDIKENKNVNGISLSDGVLIKMMKMRKVLKLLK
jgi:hypothetical protein